MPSNSTVNDLAIISQYLWASKILKDQAFKGGSIDSNRDTVLYMERKALEYGIAQSLTNVTGTANYVYSLIGGQLQFANQVLSSGSGGIVPSTSGAGSTSLTVYSLQFNIGGTGDLFGNGGTVGTINIGVGNNFLSNSFQMYLDQVIMPRDSANYVSYSLSYAAGIVTVTLNSAASTGQLYIINFDYIIV